MSWLGDIYNSTKKKLQDWENPIQQSVSSGLGKISQNISNYVAPKIQSFDNNFVQPTENFVQQSPKK